MKVEEMRSKSIGELEGELLERSKALFQLRVQEATGQPARSHRYAELRREIARLKTVMNEKRKGPAVDER